MLGGIYPDGNGYIVKFPTGKRGKRIQKRCDSLKEAEKLLNALRYHSDQGTLDPRDYLAESPLAFNKLAMEWLLLRKKDMKNVKSWRVYELHISRAVERWGNRNLKAIKKKDIQEFINFYDVGNKTKANMLNCLSSFWGWLLENETIQRVDVPVFPKQKFKLRKRKTVKKEVQEQILNEIHRQTFEKNPKIWLGVKWLATYICLRPGDLFRIQEKHIDRRNRTILICDPKASEPYTLPLTTQDLETLLRSAPGEPDEPFFRHTEGTVNAKTGTLFGERYFYNHWKDACETLGIEGVDLYGGTRHSSAIAMRRSRTPEQIKGATQHRTSASFERYFWMDKEDLREMYEEAEPCTTLVPPIPAQQGS